MIKGQIDIGRQAEKIYKNKKYACELILRELISNAYHALIIGKQSEPQINIIIDPANKTITVIDNGSGFSKADRDALLIYSAESETKKAKGLPSKGEGRLVLVYFANTTQYTTVCQDNNLRKEYTFSYPQKEQKELFEDMSEKQTEKQTGTEAVVFVDNKNKIWETFTELFKDIKSEEIKCKLQDFLEREFFYLFVYLENLKLSCKVLDPVYNFSLEKKVYKTITFSMQGINDFGEKDNFEDKNSSVKFKVYILEISGSEPIEIIPLAHHMPVKLTGKIDFEYDRLFNKYSARIYLQSQYFEDRLIVGGQYLEIDPDVISQINVKLTSELDRYFSHLIEEQKELNIQAYDIAYNNLKPFQQFFPERESINGFKIKKKEDYQKKAFEEFNQASLNYLSNEEINDERVITTSLYMYVIHRQRIVKYLFDIITRWTEEGEKNKTLEDEVHDLVFKRGYSTENSDESYHKHNLWLIDDKFSFFSFAESTKRGQKKTDIYLYLDREPRPLEIVLIELKRPQEAHNPKNMIQQVRDYASDIYNENEIQINKRSINTKDCIFYGYILAGKDDIKKEVENAENAHKIPFLKNSYFLDPHIPRTDMQASIHIELLSYEDLAELAENRNKAFSDFVDNVKIKN